MHVRFNQFELDVSDVPCDSLLLLTRALERILSGSGTEVVDWSLEPEYANWIFEREGDELVLHLKEHSGAKSALVEKASVGIVVDEILSALGTLAIDPCWAMDADEFRNWSWPFPFAEFERLKTQRAAHGGADQPTAVVDLKSE